MSLLGKVHESVDVIMKNWLYRLSLMSKNYCCQSRKWLFVSFVHSDNKVFALNLYTGCSRCSLQIVCMNVLAKIQKVVVSVVSMVV